MINALAASAAVCVLFGLVRGLAIVVCVRARTSERLRSVVARVDALGPASVRLACAVQAAVGVGARRRGGR